MTNIVLITSDQHRADCLGFGGRGVHTPHIDALARNGVRFDACFTPNPVCQPARASLLTGLLPLTHGVVDNGYDLPADTGENGFGGRLAKKGYATGFIGKAHFATSHTFEPTGSPECRESTAKFAADWFGPYMGFNHVELVVEGHNNWLPMEPPHGQHYERWYDAGGKAGERNALYQSRLEPDTDAVQTWNSGLPAAWHNSTWIGDRSIEFLREKKRRGEAFLLWASFPDPHHPFDAPAPWCHLHRPEDIRLPKHRVLDLERRAWWHKASHGGSSDPRVKAIRGNFLEFEPQTDEQLRAITANYFGMISLIDHNVGRILTVLDELQLTEDTIVIFASDHGEWLGDHGLMFKGPILYEGLVRVPLVVSGSSIARDRQISEPVSLLDIAPTICALGEADEEGFHGRKLNGFLNGGSDSRDHAYGEWDLDETRCGVALGLRMIRTQRFKMTFDLHSEAGELYDLESDPAEMDNVFDSRDYAAIRTELIRKIDERPDDILKPPLQRVGMA